MTLITRRSTQDNTWTIEEELLNRVLDDGNNELLVTNTLGQSVVYSAEEVLDIWFNRSKPTIALATTCIKVRVVEFPWCPAAVIQTEKKYTSTQKAFLKRMGM